MACYLVALKRLAVADARREHLGQIRVGAENVFVGAVTQGLNSERLFRRGIRRSDRACRAHEQQPGGHVARDFFGDALRLAGTFLLDAMQPGEFAFLGAQFLDNTLHGRCDER